MSKNTHITKSSHGSKISHDEAVQGSELASGLTTEEVKNVVAETVEQLVTTQQEKPEAQDQPSDAEALPAYDVERMKTLNVSGAVRYLASLGYSRGQIVKEFPKAKGRTILYQHVRNVLITPVKSNS